MKWLMHDAPQAGVLVGLLSGVLLVLFVLAASLVAVPGARLLVGPGPQTVLERSESSSNRLPPAP